MGRGRTRPGPFPGGSSPGGQLNPDWNASPARTGANGASPHLAFVGKARTGGSEACKLRATQGGAFLRLVG
jgi:hypothetical protein